ncbi:sulfur carrier protein ThiS [Vibrio alginolyticus]|uniref:sulfur carrier protein ThiS n=1 Tax=Vibrio TaxID=662 RepID=UPI001BD37A63|nr:MULTISPECIES: sulfur carrier protein ThiS [Vibrio]MBS9944579.1 sulfur carrier protein ThiS [Vibrio alginolyticus]MDW2061998.1 sulfur carrier protein ThiS [Vibrio sp. Vb1076]
MTLSEQQTIQMTAADLDVITIVINNDQSHQVASESNLQQIISQFALPEMGCVFAINNNVVPRSEWASTVLSQGDSISLFQAIAGG